MLPTGIQAPSFSLPDQKRTDAYARGVSRPKGHPLFLPQGQHAGLHQAGLRLWRALSAVSGKGRGGAGREQGQRRLPQKVREKYGLPFTLLSDEGLEAIRAYDVWQEKNMYGKKTMGVVRTTYLIDESGVIVRALSKSKRRRTRGRCWTRSKEGPMREKHEKTNAMRALDRVKAVYTTHSYARRRGLSAAWRWRACWGRTSAACSKRW